MTDDALRDKLAEIEEGLLYVDGFDDCIVGFVEQFGQRPIVCYDTTKVLDKLVRGGLTEQQATEHYRANIVGVGGYVGEHTPCFVTKVS